MSTRTFFLMLSCVALPFACTPDDTVAREDAATAADTVTADVPPDRAPADVDTPTDAALDGATRCGNVSTPTIHVCTPATPTAEPGCFCVIGAYWNGTACVALNGCRCSAGCDRVYPTQASCEAAHGACRPDGGATPDASATFACGEMLRCQTGAQYCHETIPGVPGAMRTYRCEALTAGCSRCACIADAMMPGAVCEDSTPGEITVRVALP